MGVMNQISEEIARYCMVQERVKIAGFWSRQDTFVINSIFKIIGRIILKMPVFRLEILAKARMDPSSS